MTNLVKRNLHKQVAKQLDYWKSCVDAEVETEKRCKEWNIPYEPSRRKWEDISLYEKYKREVEKNGDKILLVMVKMRGDNGINMYGVYPFARRYDGEEYLIYRDSSGGEVLVKESNVKIIHK